jgi:hypothetical protein
MESDGWNNGARETDTARQRRCKQATMPEPSLGNESAGNNGETTGGGVFYAVSAETIKRETAAVTGVLSQRLASARKRGPEPWNTEAYDIVGIRWQATPNEDIEDLLCTIARSNVCELAIEL